jgi:hypothetical protein
VRRPIAEAAADPVFFADQVDRKIAARQQIVISPGIVVESRQVGPIFRVGTAGPRAAGGAPPAMPEIDHDQLEDKLPAAVV